MKVSRAYRAVEPTFDLDEGTRCEGVLLDLRADDEEYQKDF